MTVAPEDHHHRHDYLSDTTQAERSTRLVVILTLVMMVGEIIGGLVFRSMALMADGFHMGTHALALGLALIAYTFARRHRDNPAFPFGPGKAYDLGGFASAILLLSGAGLMAVESVERIFSPVTIHYGEAIGLATLGLLVNLVSAFLLARGGHTHDHDHDHGGGQVHSHPDGHPAAHQDNNLRAAYLHVLADALTSILAISALLLGWKFGWVWMDPAMGLVGAAVIIRWGVGLLRDTANSLMGRNRDLQLAEDVRHLFETNGEDRVLDLHIWEINRGQNFVIISLATPAPLPLRDYKARLREFPSIVHSTIEIVPVSPDLF